MEDQNAGMSRRELLASLTGIAGIGAIVGTTGCSRQKEKTQTTEAGSTTEKPTESKSKSKDDLAISIDQLTSDWQSKIIDQAQIEHNNFLDKGYGDLDFKDITDVTEEEDGDTLTAHFTGTCTNGEIEVNARYIATYTKSGSSWDPQQLTKTALTYNAVAAIDKDPMDRFPEGSKVTFDEDSQTCRVTVTPEAQWFETIDGTYDLLYHFGVDRWWFDGVDRSKAKVSFQNMVGTYHWDNGSASVLPEVVDLQITDVTDDGTITGKLDYTVGGQFTDADKYSADVTGKLYYFVLSDGSHRVGTVLEGTFQPGDGWANWTIRADNDTTSDNGYTKVLGVAGALNTDAKTFKVEVPEAQSAKN